MGSITVTDGIGNTVFSKQNFTYTGYNTYYSGFFQIGYVVVLNFLPLAGETYHLTVLYEVFW